jgi:hypothetical protein
MFNPYVMGSGMNFPESDILAQLGKTQASVSPKNTVREALNIMGSTPGQYPLAETRMAKAPNSSQSLFFDAGGGGSIGPVLDIPIVRPAEGGTIDFDDIADLYGDLQGGVLAGGLSIPFSYSDNYKLSDIIPSIILGLLAVVIIGIGVYKLT